MSGFDPRLFDLLVRYEQSSFWFVNRAKLITSLLRHYYPQAKNFLEIGCGTGSVLLAIRQAMPELQLTGSELHPLGLRYARERLGSDVTLLQMDARNIPCRDQFDVVGAFDVIEHIAEDERVLQAIHRSLKPRGGALFSVPQHRWMWSPADDDAFHQRRYARGELEGKLEAAGFRVQYTTSFNAILLPLMMISRWAMILRRKGGQAPDALSEFRMSKRLNRVLSLILDAEVRLTARGMSWPIGGSRVVVAQKR